MKSHKPHTQRFRIQYAVGSNHATFLAEVPALNIHEAVAALKRANPQRDIRILSFVNLGRG